jgi:hypothetical protein
MSTEQGHDRSTWAVSGFGQIVTDERPRLATSTMYTPTELAHRRFRQACAERGLDPVEQEAWSLASVSASWFQVDDAGVWEAIQARMTDGDAPVTAEYWDWQTDAIALR